MKIITIIPAYNEEKSIKSVVKRTLHYSDVLVVDDGSTDLTSSLVKETGVQVLKHQKNKGKGAAIKTGLNYVINKDYDMLILMDGDGQHDPSCIPRLLSGMDKMDMRICSRFSGETPLNMSLQRRISNRITTYLIKYLTGYNLTDSQCGFRVITIKSAPLLLDIPYNDYIYESEVIFQAAKNNLKFDEISIKCTYGEEKSYIRIWHVLKYIIFILTRIIYKFRKEVKI
jgi:glycosyltransferase involved in cell wall biosynthesis